MPVSIWAFAIGVAKGVEKNLEKAKECYQKAIDDGNDNALVNMGVVYELEKNMDKAEQYYKMAAEAGNADGQFCYGMQFYNREEYDKAVSWSEKAAEQEEPDAQTQLGICYFEGHGVESNPIIGAWYLYAAADQDWQRAIDLINENNIPRPTEEELEAQIRDV